MYAFRMGKQHFIHCENELDFFSEPSQWLYGNEGKQYFTNVKNAASNPTQKRFYKNSQDSYCGNLL